MKSQKIRIGIVSLGCPKTLVDSEVVLGRLKDSPFEIARPGDESDVVLVNTCGFIRDAKAESIDAILKLGDQKKQGRILALIVMGCLVQRYAAELEKNFPEVDAFLGSGNYDRVVRVIRKVIGGQRPKELDQLGYLGTAKEKRVSLTSRFSRYLKISEGCDHACSFCMIPKLRGRFRSRRISDVITEARKLALDGAKEIILVGQDITGFGFDYARKLLLPELLHELESIEELRWIRLLYAYPHSVNEALIRQMANSKKICRYLDLPLQHISDKILKAMRRGFSRGKTIELIKRLRCEIPGLVLRTGFIVGFPGESEGDFRELLDFIKHTKFERAGVFKYSREEGSPAAKFRGQVSEKIKERRFHEAMRCQRKVALAVSRRHVGRELEVLIERRSGTEDGAWEARSYMDAPEIDTSVIVRSRMILREGTFKTVRITGTRDYDLIAEA